MGALDIQRDLLRSSNHVDFYTFSSNNIAAEASYLDQSFIVTCKPRGPSDYPHCGIAIALAEGWPEQGFNVGDYHTVELEVEMIADVNEPRIRASFRNFDPIYAINGDTVSLKFNSISYAPSKYPGKIRVPLNSFQVESWWVEERKIEFANAHLDFSNIAVLEFVTDTLHSTDTATFIVKEATLYGELVSEKVLIWSMAGLSLLIMCLLIALQHYRLHIASITDSLTGLNNRRGLTEWVDTMISHFPTNSNLTMFYFDIDDFKKVNDTRGHLCGDELLRSFCDLILNEVENAGCKRVPQSFGRISGDEFALIFRGLPKSKVTMIANGVTHASRNPIHLSCGTLKVNFSLGIASSDENTKTFDTLLSKADAAMYHVKRRGKGTFKIFDESVAEDVLNRKVIAEKLTIALQKEEFSLVFMPIFETKTLRIAGCEVLLRCTSSELAGIGPDKFIPVAEQYDLIDKIDTWVLETALKTVAKFCESFPELELTFAINISANQLHNSKFINDVRNFLKLYSVDTKFLELEITETSLVEIDEEAIDTLEQFKRMGLKLSLDDFGTGYTAFNQLINFPVDCLKIDKMFTDQVTAGDTNPVVMVNAILSIANSYKLKTTAEGIEYEHQLEYMKSYGCDRAQGYYFSKPLPYDEYTDFVRSNLNA